MMRCDVTKFNKRFGICKVGRGGCCCCCWGLQMQPSRTSRSHVAGQARRALHQRPGVAPAARPPSLRTRSPSPAHPPTHPHTVLQVAAKAYVGEDLVCEADLTLVMGK